MFGKVGFMLPSYFYVTFASLSHNGWHESYESNEGHEGYEDGNEVQGGVHGG